MVSTLYKTLAQWIENDGKSFHGVYVCPSTKVRDDSVNNRFLASTKILAELGQIRIKATPFMVRKDRGYKAPAASERYVNPGGTCLLKQQGGNQLTKKHMTKGSGGASRPATTTAPTSSSTRPATEKSNSYCVRVRAEGNRCASTPSSTDSFYAQVEKCSAIAGRGYAEELMEEGLDVVHVLDVSKCQATNYGDRAPAGDKKSARPAKKPGRRPAPPLAAGGAALAGHGRAALAPLAGREDRRRARISGSAAARAGVFARRAGRRAGGPHAGLGVHRAVTNAPTTTD